MYMNFCFLEIYYVTACTCIIVHVCITLYKYLNVVVVIVKHNTFNKINLRLINVNHMEETCFIYEIYTY